MKRSAPHIIREWALYRQYVVFGMDKGRSGYSGKCDRTFLETDRTAEEQLYPKAIAIARRRIKPGSTNPAELLELKTYRRQRRFFSSSHRPTKGTQTIRRGLTTAGTSC